MEAQKSKNKFQESDEFFILRYGMKLYSLSTFESGTVVDIETDGHRVLGTAKAEADANKGIDYYRVTIDKGEKGKETSLCKFFTPNPDLIIEKMKGELDELHDSYHRLHKQVIIQSRT
jgi:hypothetical protein